VEEVLDSISAPYQNVNMAGKSIPTKLQLISNLDVMLYGSGNAHIAAMLGVKVVTLWGATSFASFTIQ
jgi:ADP-heptose:LPS heptosyltransferase